MSRYARHKDASHSACVKAFEALGCSVLVIDCSSKDAWDLEVGFLRRDRGVEVKPTLVKGRAISTTLPRPSQQAYFDKWRGAPIRVVRTVEDVAALIALWRQESEVATRAAIALAESTGSRPPPKAA